MEIVNLFLLILGAITLGIEISGGERIPLIPVRFPESPFFYKDILILARYCIFRLAQEILSIP